MNANATNKKVVQIGKRLLVTENFGTFIYREAKPGDMPMIFAFGKHWHATGYIEKPRKVAS